MFDVFLLYIKKILKILIVLIFFILITRSFIIEPGRVNGRSMEKTFIDDDIFFVNKLFLLTKKPRRGDIVQYINDINNEVIIKRVIGLPGEQVKIFNNHVYIITTAGEEIKLAEPYLDEYTLTKTPLGNNIIYPPIPENEYFLLGDNRGESKDSRYVGTINRSYITGSVIKLPFSK
ncbi:MAG: signal peptidase I [bacterium]|nr:signal peptidase I [bacterium]